MAGLEDKHTQAVTDGVCHVSPSGKCQKGILMLMLVRWPLLFACHCVEDAPHSEMVEGVRDLLSVEILLLLLLLSLFPGDQMGVSKAETSELADVVTECLVNVCCRI